MFLQQQRQSQCEHGRGTHAVDGEHRDRAAGGTVDGDGHRGAHAHDTAGAGGGGVDGVGGIDGVDGGGRVDGEVGFGANLGRKSRFC